MLCCYGRVLYTATEYHTHINYSPFHISNWKFLLKQRNNNLLLQLHYRIVARMSASL